MASTLLPAEHDRIRLKAYDHQLIDSAAETIVEAAKRPPMRWFRPYPPLPTKTERSSRSSVSQRYKDSREQFERRTHKRLIDIMNPTQKTVEDLRSLREVPAGVEIGDRSSERRSVPQPPAPVVDREYTLKTHCPQFAYADGLSCQPLDGQTPGCAGNQ